jgi:hypothetical protein
MPFATIAKKIDGLLRQFAKADICKTHQHPSILLPDAAK